MKSIQLTRLAAAFALGFAFCQVHAQATSGASSPMNSAPGALEEIVVTAQKREQNLSDVGESIVSASKAQLQAAGVEDIMDLGKIVPGFTAATNFTGTPSFSVRGINLFSAQVSAPPAVSVYVDEVPLPYSVMTEWAFMDVERVEVDKGPQGTLFGQNSTGGSINIIAAKPTDHLSGGFRTDVNNFGEIILEAFISGPLANNLNARLAVDTTQFGAWQHGYYLNDAQNGVQNKSAARLLLDWTPTERLTVSTNFTAGYDRGQAQLAQLASLAIEVPGAGSPGLPGYRFPSTARDAETSPDINSHQDNYLTQAAIRGDYKINDNLTATSLTSFASSRFEVTKDGSATALDIESIRILGEIKSFAQEIRLSGSVPSVGLNYIVGANYEDDSVLDAEAPNMLNDFSGIPPGTIINSIYNIDNSATGIFANADYEILPRLTLVGGVRYTETRQSQKGCTYDGGTGGLTDITGFVANLFRGEAGLSPTDAYVAGGCATINNVGATPDYLPIVGDQVQKQNNTSFRAGVNFKPTPDSLIYGMVSRGYKAGLFPVQVTIFQSSIAPVSQEELTDYEAGTKLSFFDRRLTVDTSVFYYDYRNKQFYTFVPVPPIGTATTIVNIPKSNVKGVDFDFVVQPVSQLTARAGFTYIKTEVGDYLATAEDLTKTNIEGSQFNFAPPWSATYDVEYRLPLTGSMQGYVGTGGVYNDVTYADLGQPANKRIPSYFLIDARAGVDLQNGWRLGVWGRNLTNKYYITSVTPGIDTLGKFAGQPVTYGFSASYAF